MGGHHGNVPKDPTNPLMYVPIVLLGVGLVGWVFGSGLMYGIRVGKDTPRTVVASASKKPAVNVRALAESTPEQVAKGKQLFAVNCASCHGVDGHGDGEKGVALNPPPRNFHAEGGWKNGKSIVDIWGTLEHGVPGSSMASYKLLPPDERMAMVHWISRWIPEQPELTPEDLAKLPAGNQSSAPTELVAEDSGPRVPVAYAMLKNMREEPKVLPDAELPAALRSHPGAALWAANCQSCHGAAGGGNPSALLLTSAPYVRLDVPALSSYRRAGWKADEAAFRSVLSSPLGGRAVHDFGLLSNGDVRALHAFVGELAKAER